ncbi:MAG: rane-associated phospholipid phosphatase [Gemmatimonadetes bacterium]|nr:rane-associated phospholipid phosphatase [Gemmatimonadota bacterium]
MIGHLGELIGHYGYLIVAAFIFFEGIAIPFPTDATLITAAAFAAHGRLSVPILFVVASVCSTAGTTIAFVLGRRGGDFFERHSRKVHPAILSRTRSFFERHGASAIVAGRFIPFARMLISPMAGLSTMSLARFSAFNAIGAVLWSATFCAVGVFFGQHPPAFGQGIARGALVVTLGLAVITIVIVAGGYLVEESDAAWRAEGTLWHRVLMSPPLRWLAARSPRARAFLFRRFTPGHYLGLNLTIGLGLSFVSLVIFGALANSLLAREAVPQFDLELASALRETATPSRDAFWGVLSMLGTFRVMLVPGVTMAIWLGMRRLWLPLGGLLAAGTGAALLEVAVRRFMLHPHAGSLAAVGPVLVAPSGQALGALVFYGMLGYFLVLLLHRRGAAPLVVAASLLLVAAICFGRLYLGTRYFSDVVSGLAAGGVWLCFCITGLEVARRRMERDRQHARIHETDRR